MKTSISNDTCKRNSRRSKRLLVDVPSAPIYIQFIRDVRLFGLEIGEATQLLEVIKISHDCPAVRENASLLLSGIKEGREIFDEKPLISDRGRREKSPPIYIHDEIISEIANAIKAASRARGGRDD